MAKAAMGANNRFGPIRQIEFRGPFKTDCLRSGRGYESILRVNRGRTRDLVHYQSPDWGFEIRSTHVIV